MLSRREQSVHAAEKQKRHQHGLAAADGPVNHPSVRRDEHERDQTIRRRETHGPGDRVGRDIFMYSITLDPEHDTPEVLKAFHEAFHIAPGWLFLTGKPEDIDLIRYKLGERSRSLAEHRHEAPLGNDRTGQWTKVSPYDDLDRIVETILEMDPAWRAQRKRGNKQNYDYANVAAARIGDQRGQGLFIKACAACHTIGQEDHVGPDLMGVTARRTTAAAEPRSSPVRRPSASRTNWPFGGSGVCSVTPASSSALALAR